MKDNTIVDNGLKLATQVMTNKMNADFFAECAKATINHEVSATAAYEGIVDAIAKLNLEDESKLFIIAPTACRAVLRKDEDYKAARMGEVVYNG
jgi:hypothetical protein